MSEHLESVTITGYKSIRELRDFPLRSDINLLIGAGDRSLFFAHESAPFNGPIHGWTENDQGSGHFESRLLERPSRSRQWVVDTISGCTCAAYRDRLADEEK
ncbi:MAG: hypothetical protein Tsb0020_03960 [Haliangiales bacterium]